MNQKNSDDEFLAEGRAIEDYFTEKGLRAHIGLPSNLWNYAIFKEVLDNSLDSIEFLPQKQIQIETSEKGLWISDPGPGLTLESITSIYNFYGYFSSKRWTRSIHRGSLGNALKSIIGLCYIKQYPLEWRLKSGVALRCLLNEIQKNRGTLFFETSQRKYEGSWGIYVEGFQVDFDLEEKLSGFYWANPDVTFLLNASRYEAFSKPFKRKRKAFLHWYDWESFHLLANRKCRIFPRKTTSAFLKEFSGASRIRSFPTPPPTLLQEYVDQVDELHKLYLFLLEQIPPPALSLLKTFVATRKEYASKLNVCAYKEKSGTYISKEATIPFLLQGMLVKTSEANRILSTVNGSVPYQDFPFLFPETDVCFMGFEEKTAHQKSYLYKGYHSLKEALQHLHFFKGSGHLLILNVISPWIEFSDSAKTQINATGFQREMETLVESLIAPVLKEIRREELGFLWGLIYPEKGYKKELMHRHFLDAFELSSGGYSVFVRQVFYKLHEILNHLYGIDLRSSDYQYLTQTLATQMIQQESQVAQRLLFSVRGYFHHSFYDFDLPLGTKEIRDYASLTHQNKILVSRSTQFDFEDRYLLKNILFIEKAGFNIVLEESGLTQELNLSILSTQGNNTRAGAMLLHYFQEQQLHLYSLTDYDFAGLKIHDSMSVNSPTYSSISEIARIGLSLNEIHEMKLMPEVITYKKEYRKFEFFKRLPAADQNFFTKEDTLGIRKFQRVELNALSNQQLIDLLRKKISEKKVLPPDEIILKAFEMDELELKKTALFEKLGPLLQDWQEIVCKEEVLKRVKASSSHWLESLPQAKAEYEKYLIQKFCQKLEEIDLISLLKKQKNSEG
ncbi:MAG: hypothetical protein AABZ60_07130 [Planctomycetota bacterium]